MQFAKALFIVVETLFLGYFHKARLPLDTPLLQMSLAHLLGTNLALWFWTLREETRAAHALNCANRDRTPNLGWSKYQKYFYPIFIEYLILALAILYELWMNLGRGEQTLCRVCRDCTKCLYRQNTVSQNDDETSSRRKRYLPRCGYGVMLGTVYTAVFFILILLAIFDANHKPKYTKNKDGDAMIVTMNYDLHGPFVHYCYGTIVMYLTMTCACFIILASLRSPNNVQRVRSIDYDDVLLYVSLMGILLVEGFHFVSKMIAGRGYFHLVAVDITGIFQHLTQAVTLVSLGHHPGAKDRRVKAWICECILFLLLVNLAWWTQDSFYLDPKLTRPGEIGTIEGLET